MQGPVLLPGGLVHLVCSVFLVCLVSLVYLVCLVCLVEPDQPNRPDGPDRSQPSRHHNTQMPRYPHRGRAGRGHESADARPIDSPGGRFWLPYGAVRTSQSLRDGLQGFMGVITRVGVKEFPRFCMAWATV